MLKLLLVVALLALVIYATARAIERRGVAPIIPRPTRPAPPTRPVSPDDDPDFLRQLDQERRRRLHEQPPPGGAESDEA